MYPRPFLRLLFEPARAANDEHPQPGSADWEAVRETIAQVHDGDVDKVTDYEVRAFLFGNPGLQVVTDGFGNGAAIVDEPASSIAGQAVPPDDVVGGAGSDSDAGPGI